MKWLFFLLVPSLLFAQKPALDVASTRQWARVNNATISNDGNYVCYYSSNEPAGASKLVIQALNSSWRREFQNARNAVFFQKGIVFQINRDSLCVSPFNMPEYYLTGVTQFKNGGDWLFYQSNTGAGRLIAKNIITGVERRFDSVLGYFFSSSSVQSNLVLLRQEDKVNSVQVVNLETEMLSRIWSSANANATAFCFDDAGEQLAFISEDKVTQASTALWHYNIGRRRAMLMASNVGEHLSISNGETQFSSDGKRIFFKLQPLPSQKVKLQAVQVDVCSFLDAQLQSEQAEEIKRGDNGYAAVIDLESKNIVRLEGENETIIGRTNDFVLVKKELGLRGRFEAYWNKEAQLSFLLVSLKDGRRKLLKDKVSNASEGLQLSPLGKWIVFYDIGEHNYYCYRTSNGTLYNITKSVRLTWTDNENDNPDWALPSQPIKWMAKDSALIVGDTYDLWLLDPSGVKSPICLTKGYGSKNRIQFEVINSEVSVNAQSTILLKAINTANKDWGFYRISLGGNKEMERLFMGPYIFGAWSGHGSYNALPLKAKDAEVWLVQRSSATEAPNFFVTSDFKTFKPLTNVQSHKSFNWYTTELHQWKSMDGKMLQGILYKPENFDSTKKYPVIFDYYERRSEELNMFIMPNASDSRINIPLFVGNGYLVFVPDIKYTIGYPGRSAYNSVVSSAMYLSKFKWVDSKHMGLQGHSFGGLETNYIVTHTKIFAAACSAAGASDQISKYGSGLRAGFAMYIAEKSQTRLGSTPWERPEFYLENSPIIDAHKLSTPLLMMHNRNDGAVPFSQGVEFFTSLRRLGKRAWMLQYDNGGHVVDGKDAEDFHTRMMQFFNHYLKDSACPKWMLHGIPAKDKGVDDGLELVRDKDVNGKWLTPPEGGLLTPEERKKVEALRQRKPVTITLD